MNTGILATVADVVQATGGKLVAGDPGIGFTGVSTDSRTPRARSLFVALRGENFDGSRFCRDAVAGGSSAVLVERAAFDRGLGELGQAAVVAVEDTLKALADLASWHRARHAVRVVGITGSNGKTSTKEMTAAVLGGEPAVLFNRGNFNNQIGMPRALLSLQPSHSHVVLEMGMNAPGEIRALARIARPQVGVITNVHPVHLEGLGSIDAVARAKGELLESLPPDGIAILNIDDPYVLKQRERSHAPIRTFGRGPNADVRVVRMQQRPDGLEVELNLAGSTLGFRLGRPGLHNAMNAAAAAAVGWVEGVPADAIAARLELAPLPPMRMERIACGNGNLLVDCYNANPRSVQAALQTLAEMVPAAERFAVLGDMRELGHASDDLHRQTGRAAADAGLAGLCTFGGLAHAIATGARDQGLEEVAETESIDTAVAWTRERLDRGGTVLLKGSRAMRMERIVAKLTGSPSPGDGHEDAR